MIFLRRLSLPKKNVGAWRSLRAATATRSSLPLTGQQFSFRSALAKWRASGQARSGIGTASIRARYRISSRCAAIRQTNFLERQASRYRRN